MAIEPLDLVVPNVAGAFGASKVSTTLDLQKSVQLVAPGTDGVELWATLDPTPTDLSTYHKVIGLSGGGLTFTTVASTGLRARRVVGTTVGYSLRVAAKQLDPSSTWGLGFQRGSDAMAADVQAETPALQVTGARTIDRITFAAESAVALDAVDFLTAILRARASDGTLLGVIGTFTTSTTAIVAFTSGENVVPAGVVTALPDGATLTFELTKDGAGQVLPITSWTVHFRP